LWFCKDLADTFITVLFRLSGPFALLGSVYRVVNIIHRAKRLHNEFFIPTPMLPLVTGGV
jgi:hypothetical protein